MSSQFCQAIWTTVKKRFVLVQVTWQLTFCIHQTRLLKRHFRVHLRETAFFTRNLNAIAVPFYADTTYWVSVSLPPNKSCPRRRPTNLYVINLIQQLNNSYRNSGAQQSRDLRHFSKHLISKLTKTAPSHRASQISCGILWFVQWITITDVEAALFVVETERWGHATIVFSFDTPARCEIPDMPARWNNWTHLSSKFRMKLSVSILSSRTKSPTPTSLAVAIFAMRIIPTVTFHARVTVYFEFFGDTRHRYTRGRQLHRLNWHLARCNWALALLWPSLSESVAFEWRGV